MKQISDVVHTDLLECAERFSIEMQARLEEKRQDGWTGWRNKDFMTPILRKRIKKNMDDGHWIDVANLAMFAWEIGLKEKK